MLDELIRKTIREMVGGSSGPPVTFLTTKGDRGLFGPESIAWRVHAKLNKPVPSTLEKVLVNKSIDLIAIPVRDALKYGVAAQS